MKKTRFFFTMILFICQMVHLSAQDDNISRTSFSLGFINSFQHQKGVEMNFDYEGRLLNGWMGIYMQGRYAELDNSVGSSANFDFSTSRFDLALGYRQYLTPNLSIFRPNIGVGLFASFQNYEIEIARNTYLLTDETGYGFEWEQNMLFVYDSIAWGFGYKGTFLNISMLSDDIQKYENHFYVTFSICF